MGLGHKRRNLLIAQNLGLSPLNVDILLITGTNQSNNFSGGDGIDCVTLPALYKNERGSYEAKQWQMSLDEIVKMRSHIILATIQNFKPDILIVDNVPKGAMGELKPTLKYLKKETNTFRILGLRDILDDPKTVYQEWKKAKNEKIIRTYYNEVWIYGDPMIYDAIKEYKFSTDIASKFRYTGYFDQRSRLDFSSNKSNFKLNNKDLALCMVGGGQDGANLALTFAQTILPNNVQGIIITGPFMPKEVQEYLLNIAKNRSNLWVWKYVKEPTFLLKEAKWVISMGGYNSTSEILSFEKRALIIPRINPRREQLIRIQRLQELGLVDMLHPDNLTPDSLAKWLKEEKNTPQVHNYIDFHGLKRIPLYLNSICQQIQHKNSSNKFPMVA
ncbi:glycosyltransferase [Cyanobacterium stanieri LEGE 03274]|uniref:Glycosyltransferase n=2 Tax=Cyanobacterium TaxID=102234 RepID=A0ABR9V1L2_9CHRO|nr:glycosyltransferase [Cyanobacterium stanieri LEGE 03274]